MIYTLPTQTSYQISNPRTLAPQWQPYTQSKNVIEKNSSEKIDDLLKTFVSNNCTLSVNGTLPLIWKQFDYFCNLQDNQHGEELTIPNHISIEKAKIWLSQMQALIAQNNFTWFSPNITADHDGNIVVEWADGQKRLCVYISENCAWYIKAWGPDILNEMLDGDANTPEERLNVLKFFQE